MDIETLRRETPGCHNVIHFNNAGAALMPKPVLDAMVSHLTLEAAIGGYEAANAKAAEIEHTYDAVAQLIGCESREIAIVENATRAWDMAFYSFPFQPGDKILTSHVEYASNYIAFLQMAEQKGIEIEVIPHDDSGQISVSHLAKAIDERSRLICLTHIPTNGGLVNPAAEVGKIARQAGIPFLLDACQSVGQMPIDVDELGCDMLSATGRKFLRGPRGIGFLYVRQNWIDKLKPPFLDLHAATWTAVDQYQIRSDARRFENWETNYASKIALGVAADYALNIGLTAIWERVQTLANRLRQSLTDIPGVQIQDLGTTRCGIVSFTVEGLSSQAVYEALQQQKINVSYSPQVYTRMDMQERGLQDIVRASVHYYNTDFEIEQFCSQGAGNLISGERLS
jgi:cysteine desulfurase / selenocysteine lyase